jgi:hypothetical protein
MRRDEKEPREKREKPKKQKKTTTTYEKFRTLLVNTLKGDDIGMFTALQEFQFQQQVIERFILR